MLVSPEIDVIIDSFSEPGLVSASTARSEVHLEPVLLQVVVEVPPSGFDVIDEECMSPTSACEEGETADSPQSTVGDYVSILRYK